MKIRSAKELRKTQSEMDISSDVEKKLSDIAQQLETANSLKRTFIMLEFKENIVNIKVKKQLRRLGYSFSFDHYSAADGSPVYKITW